jgi:hypothetical protein
MPIHVRNQILAGSFPPAHKDTNDRCVNMDSAVLQFLTHVELDLTLTALDASHAVTVVVRVVNMQIMVTCQQGTGSYLSSRGKMETWHIL